ncbi:acetylcholine receptor subunit alpha-like [Lineus longissimus]|uniref:acetylcholine receptor subunit alpha-like n=1 Tax=Lineus longissimus TaxID=88925 RepID=UPI00315DF8BB
MAFNGVRIPLLLLLGVSSLKAVVALTDMAGQPTKEDELLADLLDGYNPNAKPVDTANQRMQITTSFSLITILSVDDRTQTVSFTGMLTMMWMDSHLKWNPAKYGNVTEVQLPCKSVWRPDTGLLNT